MPSTAREQILTAATELLREENRTSITVRDIANRAGVQPSVINRYFGGKEDLFREITLRTRVSFAQAVDSAASPREAFEQAFDFVADNPFLLKLLVEPALNRASGDLPMKEPPILTVHIKQIERARRAQDRSSGHGGGGMERERAIRGDARLATVFGYTLMGGWSVWEAFAMSTILPDLDRDQVRAELRRVATDMVMREAGLETEEDLADPGKRPRQ